MKNGIKKFHSMLNRNIEEIQSHLEEIVHLKEKEIKLTKMKQLEFEQEKADQKKYHLSWLRLSKVHKGWNKAATIFRRYLIFY